MTCPVLRFPFCIIRQPRGGSEWGNRAAISEAIFLPSLPLALPLVLPLVLSLVLPRFHSCRLERLPFPVGAADSRDSRLHPGAGAPGADARPSRALPPPSDRSPSRSAWPTPGRPRCGQCLCRFTPTNLVPTARKRVSIDKANAAGYRFAGTIFQLNSTPLMVRYPALWLWPRRFWRPRRGSCRTMRNAVLHARIGVSPAAAASSASHPCQAHLDRSPAFPAIPLRRITVGAVRVSAEQAWGSLLILFDSANGRPARLNFCASAPVATVFWRGSKRWAEEDGGGSACPQMPHPAEGFPRRRFVAGAVEIEQRRVLRSHRRMTARESEIF